MIKASEARALSEQTRQFMATDEYTYSRMENMIRRAASPAFNGSVSVVFEETPDCFFTSSVKTVKKNLMANGYEVEVEKFHKEVNGRCYVLHRYYIAW